MKKLILSLALAGAMGFYASPAMSQVSSIPGDDEPPELRWHQRDCLNGVFIETCWYTGDGNICSVFGQSTRDCN